MLYIVLTVWAVFDLASATSRNVSGPGVAGGDALIDTRGERLEVEATNGLGETV